MKGSVAAVGNLPNSGNAQGDAYINQSDDSLWIWNGTQWISGGSIQGPQGLQGLTGAAGADGIDGAAGAKGDPGNDGADGAQGIAGEKGDRGDQGIQGIQGIDGPEGQQGPQGQTGPTGPEGPQGQKGDTGAGGGGGGGVKYLVRLEYDINESLIPANTAFVTANGFETAGANIISQVSTGGNSGHSVTLNFSDTNPPTSIIGYGWNPATGNYTAAAYDRDTKQVQYEVGIAAFTNGSTQDGGSGQDGQWSGTPFSGAGSYNITLDVDQSALTYGNAVNGAFGQPSKLPHAYLIISF
jgi:hypothetical protein